MIAWQFLDETDVQIPVNRALLVFGTRIINKGKLVNVVDVAVFEDYPLRKKWSSIRGAHFRLFEVKAWSTLDSVEWKHGLPPQPGVYVRNVRKGCENVLPFDVAYFDGQEWTDPLDGYYSAGVCLLWSEVEIPSST